jgi:hypothetical protein
MPRIEATFLRGRAALANSDVPGQDDGRMHAIALAAARQIERERATWAHPLAQLLRAGVERRRGQVDRANARLDRASDAFGALDMPLYAAVAAFRRGDFRAADAADFMRREAIVRPDRMTALLAP